VLHVVADGLEDRFDLDLGGLDPVREVTGLQQRLWNLGYPVSDEHGVVGPSTQSAIRAFTAAQGMAEREVADDDVLDALCRAHGS
jgi:peptidoglycan hydrolase-like protein with peptidoglycan-binding domain